MASNIPSTVTIDSAYHAELERKALAWDTYQQQLTQQNPNPHSPSPTPTPTPSPVPHDRTIIVTNLPTTIIGSELTYSFLAPGGIRFYQLLPDPQASTLTALITFTSPTAAGSYLSYTSRHGFYVSQKLPSTYRGPPAAGEHVLPSGKGSLKYLLRPLPRVVIRPWTGTETVGGELIIGDEGAFCDVSKEISVGATRVLLVSPAMGVKEVERELLNFAASPKLRVELNRPLPAMKKCKGGMISIVRFCSVRDAVMMKSYLELLRKFTGHNGRTVRFVKDPMDQPTGLLGWHKFVMPKPQTTPLVSGLNLTATRHIDTRRPPRANTAPSKPIAAPAISSGNLNSSGESSTRERSSPLAKAAFMPHIKTSPRRADSSHLLCNTPAPPGDRSPAQSEFGLQLEEKVSLGDYDASDDESRSAFDDESSIFSFVTADLGSRPKFPLTGARYSYGAYLPQGEIVVKSVVTARKNITSKTLSNAEDPNPATPAPTTRNKIYSTLKASSVSIRNMPKNPPASIQLQDPPCQFLWSERLFPATTEPPKSVLTNPRTDLGEHHNAATLQTAQKPAAVEIALRGVPKTPEPDSQPLEPSVSTAAWEGPSSSNAFSWEAPSDIGLLDSWESFF